MRKLNNIGVEVYREKISEGLYFDSIMMDLSVNFQAAKPKVIWMVSHKGTPQQQLSHRVMTIITWPQRVRGREKEYRCLY